MHKIIFFPEKNVCLPYLQFFRPITQNTIIFYLAKVGLPESSVLTYMALFWDLLLYNS